MKFVDGISVPDREAFRLSIEAELKDLGFKLGRDKDVKEPLRTTTATLFGNDLTSLPLVLIQQDDLCLEVPQFLVHSLKFIESRITSEGIFRKAGSVYRQRELKKCLESGGALQGCDVHDVANLVKQFLRSLSTPLIHSRLHDPLLKAYECGNSLIILLLCSLMNIIHLHTLRYIMTFFDHVAKSCESNKMNSHNLAVVLTPNIFSKIAVGEVKMNKNKGKLLQKETALVQWMIENAEQIGFVPDHFMDQFSGFTSFLLNGNDVVSANIKRSKRSKKRNSINGMFSGLRKMVQPHRVIPIVLDFKDGLEEGVDFHQSSAKELKSAMKRKCEDNHSLIPKKSPRCEQSVHMDTPTPVMNEAAVSTAPGIDISVPHLQAIPEPRKRLSTRMKMFGKNYLKRRNSLEHMPKTDLARDQRISGAVSAHVNRIIKRFPHDKKVLTSSPSLPNVLHVVQASSKKKLSGSHTSILATDSRSTGPDVEGMPNKDDVDCQPIKLKKRKSEQRLFRSDEDISISKVRKVSIKRAASAGCRVRPLVNGSVVNQKDSFINPIQEIKEDYFMKPNPLNRSLRRGRPNTVNTGLPSESPFKTPKPVEVLEEYSFTPYLTTNDFSEGSFLYETPTFNISDWCTGLTSDLKYQDGKNEVKKVLELDEESSLYTCVEVEEVKAVGKSLPKSDSGIFELDEVKVDLSVNALESPNKVSAKAEVLSMDSGVDQSPSDGLEGNSKSGETPNTIRRSVSLKDIRANLNSFHLGERICSVEQLDDKRRHKVAEMKWENANSFLFRELRSENQKVANSGLGRPSIIQLLKEKAGNVNATAKQYDAISCGDGSSPASNGDGLTHSCPRLKVQQYERRPFSPIKIPQVFYQESPVKYKTASPCADRTNCKMDPHVFKTPLTTSVPRSMKENSTGTPRLRRGSSGKSKDCKLGVRRSNSSGKSIKKSVSKSSVIKSNCQNSPKLTPQKTKVNSAITTKRSPRRLCLRRQSNALRRRSSTGGTAI